MNAPLRTGLALVAAVVTGAGLLAGGCSGGEPAGTGGSHTTTATGGSTATTSSTTTTSSTCTPCNGTPDCPAPPACTQATCEDHCCGTVDRPAEAACAAGGNFCDGHGKCVECVSIGDCAASGTVCAVVSCTGNACVVAEAAAGAPCADNGGKACDGHGKCLECASAADCPSTGTTCATTGCGAAGTCSVTKAARGTACSDHGGAECDGSGHCAPSSCLNGAKDTGEADTDCGGACPAGCGAGKACSSASDCADGVCTGGACQAASCTDGLQNGTETDTDCGGSCPACPDKRHCSANADCQNGHCFGYAPGTCVSCADGVKDGNETDTDCGGFECDLAGKRCALGKGCTQVADCTTQYCEGSVCTGKPDGYSCGSNAECANGHCLLDDCCHVACTTQDPTTCGNTGLCDEDGSTCAKYAAGTSCGTAMCLDATIYQPSCDGAGVCNPGKPVPCPGNFACASETTCAVTCTKDADCAAGHTCSASHTCL